MSEVGIALTVVATAVGPCRRLVGSGEGARLRSLRVLFARRLQRAELL